jgi:hypothetical protein
MSSEDDLLAEKLSHTIDLLRGEIAALRAEQIHQRELSGHRLAYLEEVAKDHEMRIRAATEGVTQFKQWSGLAAGGSSILSLVALVKAFFLP